MLTDDPPLLCFVIPVRHPANMSDPAAAKTNLEQTIASISAQTSKDWKAVIVSNNGTDLPELPDRFSVKWVDFPPNHQHEQGRASLEDFREAVRVDKGRRILSGMLSMRASHFFMVVDDDDLVNKDLVQHLSHHKRSPGFVIRNGFVWSQSSQVMFLHRNFSQFCGTSHIIRRDLLGVPMHEDDASLQYVKDMLGSHIRVENILAGQGEPLEALPFVGAIYRIGHPGSHSKSATVLKTFVFKLEVLLRPKRLLKNLSSLRVRTTKTNQDFFGSARARDQG